MKNDINSVGFQVIGFLAAVVICAIFVGLIVTGAAIGIHKERSKHNESVCVCGCGAGKPCVCERVEGP